MSSPVATIAVFAPEGETPSLRDQIRGLLTEAGLSRTNSWVQRVSRDYARIAISGMPLGIFIATRLALTAIERRHIAERADLRYLLSYADPTGETAARNVDRAAR
jgi:hypothetical protein